MAAKEEREREGWGEKAGAGSRKGEAGRKKRRGGEAVSFQVPGQVRSRGFARPCHGRCAQAKWQAGAAGAARAAARAAVRARAVCRCEGVVGKGAWRGSEGW